MTTSRNTVTISLMITSIALLLVLQFLWLRGAYNKSFEELHRETNQLFRSTVLAMRDSVIEKRIEPLLDDSLPGKRILRFHTTFDSILLRNHTADTLVTRLTEVDKSGRVRVVVSSDEGASPPELEGATFKRKNLMLMLGPDSLRMDSLRIHFVKALETAQIPLPFDIIELKHGEKLPPHQGLWISEQVRVNPIHRYAVSFQASPGYLMRQIAPQILFAFFVTVLTAAAFYVTYRSLRSQQRMAALKNDFISNVTHELKTPITTVRVALEALKDFKGLDNPTLTREYLEIAQNELNRLTILTDKVLKTAIFEENGIMFQREELDLEQLVSQIMGSMKLVFEKSNAEVSFEKEGTSFYVEGSPDHLTNVIYNLLDNALKYSLARPRIRISLKDLGEQVAISVRDNGPGIPAEYHRKIFEKFFRIPTGDVHNVKGYGLGLSYVAGVVRSHHGTIEVESTPGSGACFIVTIPRHG